MQSFKQAANAAYRGFLSNGKSLRTYKDMPTKTNPFVEKWYNGREDWEYSAVVTSSMMASGFIWAFLIPYATMELMLTEFKDSEALYGTKFPLWTVDTIGYEQKPATEEQ